MQDQDDTPLDNQKNTKPTANSRLAYDSNPFSASWSGIQKLLKLNPSTTVGVAFFSIVLSIILGIAVVGLMLVTFVYVMRIAYPEIADVLFAYAGLNFLNGIDSNSALATWIILPVIIILIGTLLQALQLKLTAESAWQKTIKFGELFKSSIGSVLPIIGFALLLGLAVVLPLIAVMLIGSIAGQVVPIILTLIWLAAVAFIGLRLSLTTFCIVDQKLGPVTAMKQSWAITQDHITEIIGTICVAMLFATVPSIIFSALGVVFQNIPMLVGMIDLLSVLLAIILSIAATMAMAERYAQLQAVADKKATATALSPMNYMAIVIVIVLMIISSALSPKVDINNIDLDNDSGTSIDEWYYNSYDDQDSSLPSSTEDDSDIYFY